MNWTLQAGRHWSGIGSADGSGLTPDEFATLRAEALRWALLIVAIGGARDLLLGRRLTSRSGRLLSRPAHFAW